MAKEWCGGGKRSGEFLLQNCYTTSDCNISDWGYCVMFSELRRGKWSRESPLSKNVGSSTNMDYKYEYFNFLTH